MRPEWLELRVPPVAVAALTAAGTFAIELSPSGSPPLFKAAAPVGAALAALGAAVSLAGVAFRLWRRFGRAFGRYRRSVPRWL